MFYPAVMLAALYGGSRAGLLATALSAILADYFWIEPTGSFAVAQTADWLGLVIFLLSGTMIAWVTEALIAPAPAPPRRRRRPYSPPSARQLRKRCGKAGRSWRRLWPA